MPPEGALYYGDGNVDHLEDIVDGTQDGSNDSLVLLREELSKGNPEIVLLANPKVIGGVVQTIEFFTSRASEKIDVYSMAAGFFDLLYVEGSAPTLSLPHYGVALKKDERLEERVGTFHFRNRKNYFLTFALFIVYLRSNIPISVSLLSLLTTISISYCYCPNYSPH